MHWEGFVAGAVAGASGTLVGHAFDTAKVIEQVGGSGPRQTLNIRTLYRGILTPLLTAGFLRSLNFGVFGARLHGTARGRCLRAARAAPPVAPASHGPSLLPRD